MDDKTPVTSPAPAGNPTQDKVSGPEAMTAPEVTAPASARPRGLNASAIVVGLVAMAFAGLVIARETMNVRVDWSRLGPGAIVGIGVVMVVIGAIGLVRRHDDV